ncbi:MAG TPA: class I SAM-dependent methyltransferase [Chloroflexota bacterium]|nr:class I SAM-dependent methyltransferase [Chloroflexota bacterium]
MGARRWLFPLAAVGGALLYREWRRGSLHRMVESWRYSSMPSARTYDAMAGAVMRPFYDAVAREVTAARPEGRLLDVGCGPGWLERSLSQVAPHTEIVGVDVDPGMIDHAESHAREWGVEDHVRFQVGDVASLPFGDGEFDTVISTISMHHWPDPAAGLREIYRVLTPGGEARIYDLPDWLRRHLHGTERQGGFAQMASSSPFGSGVVVTFRWPWRLPILRCLLLRKGD